MRKITTAVLGAAATAAPLVALTVPAEAADGRCDVGDFCVWADINYGGKMVDWYGDDGYYGNDGIANAASSWANRGVSGPGFPDRVKVYNGAWQTPDLLTCLYPGAWVAWVGADDNDKASSHRWSATC